MALSMMKKEWGNQDSHKVQKMSSSRFAGCPCAVGGSGLHQARLCPIQLAVTVRVVAPHLHPSQGESWERSGMSPKGEVNTRRSMSISLASLQKWLEPLLLKVTPALSGGICMEAHGYAGICPVTSGHEFAASP